MSKEIRELIAEAREWIRSMGNVFHNESASKVIARLVDALETTIVRAERLEAQERYDVTKYRDWKRNHNPLTVSKVRKWAVEAQKEVYAGNGWITHEDYRRAVVPGNLIPVLEQVEGVVVERDAATAVIERVRAAIRQYPYYGARSAVETALDGAPEPEVLEMPETGLEVRDSDGDLISTVEHRRVLHQGGYVCDTCTNSLGLNVRWDRADRVEGHPFPVEGESK